MGELVPTGTPPIVHEYVSPDVEELASRVTLKDAVAPGATVTLTGWVAMPTVENSCRRRVLNSRIRTPKFGTRAADRGSASAPMPEPTLRADVVDPDTVRYTAVVPATNVAEDAVVPAG